MTIPRATLGTLVAVAVAGLVPSPALATTGLVPAPALAVAHGQDVAPGRYGFSVKLEMTGIPDPDGSTRDSSCSGALLAPRWVITAGHCFRDAHGVRVSRPVATRTTAIVGRTDLTGPGGRETTVVAVHQSTTTDVALAELDAAVTGVVPLPVATTAPATGETVRLTGYGLTAPDSAYPERLQTGEFTVDSVGDGLISVSGRAPRADTSACPHDSGGPYFRERRGGPELVAVVSSGPSCPHTGPDLAARTDVLADWIATTVQDRPALATWMWPGLLIGAVIAALGLGLAMLRRSARARTRTPRSAPGPATPASAAAPRHGS